MTYRKNYWLTDVHRLIGLDIYGRNRKMRTKTPTKKFLVRYDTMIEYVAMVIYEVNRIVISIQIIGYKNIIQIFVLWLTKYQYGNEI